MKCFWQPDVGHLANKTRLERKVAWWLDSYRPFRTANSRQCLCQWLIFLTHTAKMLPQVALNFHDWCLMFGDCSFDSCVCVCLGVLPWSFALVCPLLPIHSLTAVPSVGSQWFLLAPLPPHLLPHRALLGHPGKVLWIALDIPGFIRCCPAGKHSREEDHTRTTTVPDSFTPWNPSHEKIERRLGCEQSDLESARYCIRPSLPFSLHSASQLLHVVDVFQVPRVRSTPWACASGGQSQAGNQPGQKRWGTGQGAVWKGQEIPLPLWKLRRHL